MKIRLSKKVTWLWLLPLAMSPLISHATEDKFLSLCEIKGAQCPKIPTDEQGITDLVAEITKQFMQAAVEATQSPVTVALGEDTGIDPPPPVTPTNVVEEPTPPGNPFEPVPPAPTSTPAPPVVKPVPPDTTIAVNPVETPKPVGTPPVEPKPPVNPTIPSQTSPTVVAGDSSTPSPPDNAAITPPKESTDLPTSSETTPLPPITDTLEKPTATVTPPPPTVPVTSPADSDTHTICPQTTILTINCVANNQLLENITIDKGVSVSWAQLRGSITNNGMISNATLLANSTLDGGKVSGTFTNLGTVQNIHFVGNKLQHGTLAGTIVSKGELADVTLAASAKIRGESSDAPAILSGKIQGDAAHPASLEHVKITANAQVTGVTFGADVTLDPQAILELPSFNHASQVDKVGHLSETTAKFSGGLSLSEPMNFTKTLSISSSQAVRLRINIIADAEHIGQRAQRLLVAGLGKQDNSGECTGGTQVDYKVLWRYKDSHQVDLYAEPTVWAPQLINRQEEDENLTQQPLIFDDADLWESTKVTSTGCYYFFAGYRLAQNSTIVFDTTPLILNVK